MGAAMDPASQLLQFFISGLTAGAMYAIVALGFLVIFNVTGLINFAQGEFAMLGGLLTAVLVQAQVPLGLALLLAVLAATAAGAATYRLTIEPARRASIVALIIITIGVSTMLRGGALLVFGKTPRPVPSFSGETPIPVLQAVILPQALWVIGVMLLIVICFYLFLDRTLVGKAFKACAINPYAAELTGISTRRMVLLAFTISGLLGALAGALVAPLIMASYDMGVLLGIKGFIAAIFGGLTNPFGAVAAGLSLGILEAFAAGYIHSGYKDALALVVLLVVLLLRPEGLFSRRREVSGL
jgi:branched-chain amino acid transport system permease protein